MDLFGVNFSRPMVLWGLLTLVIPVILHLVQIRRYKKVYISDVSLLVEASKEGLARRNLMELLILFLRILFLCSIVFAFSGLSCTDEHSREKENVFIYIDNSPSVHGSLLESGGSENESGLTFLKRSAVSLVNSSPRNTKFSIVHNESFFDIGRFYGKELALQKIANIQNSNRIADWKMLDGLVGSLSMKNVQCEFFSDFSQFGDFESFNPPSDSEVRFYQIAPSTPKAIIDSAWLAVGAELTGGVDSLKYLIKHHEGIQLKDQVLVFNHKDGAIEERIHLSDNEDYVGSFPLESELSLGTKNAYLSFKADQGLPGRKLFLHGLVKRKSKVMLISENPIVIQGVSKIVDGFKWSQIEVRAEKEVTPSDLHQTDVLVLGQLDQIRSGLLNSIEKEVNKGMRLAIMPSLRSKKSDYVAVASTFDLGVIKGLDSLEIEFQDLRKNKEFVDVFDEFGPSRSTKTKLPKQLWYFDFEVQDAAFVESKEGRPLVLKNGNVSMFSGPVFSEKSGLDEHPYLIPLFYKVLASKTASNEIYAQLYSADAVVLNTNRANSNLTAKDPVGDDFVVTVQDGVVNIGSHFQKVGHYILDDDSVQFEIGLNHNRKELKQSSDYSGFQEKVSASKGMNLVQLNDAVDGGIELQGLSENNSWETFFVSLALFSLLGEMLLSGMKYRNSVAK